MIIEDYDNFYEDDYFDSDDTIYDDVEPEEDFTEDDKDITKTNKKRRTKEDKDYVSNAELLKEILRSRELGYLTEEATIMIMIIAKRLARMFVFPCEEDKEDCIATAMLDVVDGWHKFDPEKSNNPFSYFTQLCKNGFAKGWKILGYKDIPMSSRLRLDTESIIQL